MASPPQAVIRAALAAAVLAHFLHAATATMLCSAPAWPSRHASGQSFPVCCRSGDLSSVIGPCSRQPIHALLIAAAEQAHFT